jgi:hypothetical protein
MRRPENLRFYLWKIWIYYEDEVLRLPSHLHFSFPKDLRPKFIPPITLVWKFPNPLTCQEHFHKRTHTIMNSPVYCDGSHRYRMEIHEYNIASIAWDLPPWNLDEFLPRVHKTTVKVNRQNALLQRS